MKNKTEITTMNKVSLLSLLKKYEIEVPKLQRDYAQGREDAHSRAVRERFVKDLWEVLREKKELNLDLVYGYKESNKLILIDGQQRLTTLWLLYWYVAWKSEKTPSEEVDDSKRKVVDDLKRFTYETRVSSRDFMEELLKPQNWKPADRNAIENLGKTIKNQTWFLASWAQDPTINSMLTMLNQFEEYEKGETIDWKGEGIDYLARLEKITFSFLDMGDFKLGDDLYIKMNGRGLPLTPFENFKADLLEHIKGEAEKYGKWLDGHFLDFFWKIAQTSEKNKKVLPPDPLMMEFVNRFWVWKSIEESIENEENEDGNEQKENIVDKFSVPYESFAIYENFAGRAALDEMQRLLTFIRKLGVSKSEDEQEKWGPGLETGGAWDVQPGQKVLPSFNEKSEVSAITYTGRCIFAAICLYVKKTWNKEQKESEINSDHFRKWMRICWNITENTNTDSYEGMYNCIGLLRRLSEHILTGKDVYESLGAFNEDNIERLGSVQKRVLREEIEKAKVFGDYEETILAAEARFKGAIFFLFAKEYDETNGFRNNLCWGGKDTFEGMLKKAKQLLGKQPPNDIKNNEEEKRKRSLLWANFLFQLSCPPDKIDSDGDKFLRDKQIFDYNNEKEILTETHLLCAIYATISESPKVNPDDCKGWRKGHFRRYSGTINDKELLDFIVQEEPAARLKWRGKLCLYKPHARDGLILGPIGAIRSDVLRGLERKGKIIISPEAKQGTKNGKLSRYLWGWDIKFTYNGVNYIWHFNDSISKVGEIKEIWELKYEEDEEENIGIAREKFEKDLEEFLMINKTEKSE